MTPYRKILVPLDDTEIGARALDVALRMSAAFGAHLVLVHVHAQRAALESGEAERQLDAIEIETTALIGRAQARARELGVRPGEIEAEVRAGGVVEAIVGAAEENMSDLIVMGTHGRNGLAQMLTGSNTEKVMARTTASVLAVKPVGYPYLRDEERAGEAAVG